jgi:hypothetical protein
MYVGFGPQKIVPKPGTAGTKNLQTRKSQSIHAAKTKQSSFLRYKKLDVTSGGDHSFASTNPMK